MKNEEDRIDQIKTELYSWKTKEVKPKRKGLFQLKKKPLKNTWGELPNIDPIDEDLYKFERKGPSVFQIALILSLVFFVTAVSFAAFFLIFNKNEVKSEMVMKVTGPNSVKSGERLDFLVELDNPTDIDYRDIEFIVDYPKSTLDGDTKNFVTNKDIIYPEKLLAGGKIGQKFSAILSGTIGDVKEIRIAAYYKAGNFSNLLFSKKIYKVEIESAPVTVEMEYPKSVLSKKEFQFNVNILSNSSEELYDLVVISKYPSGFKFISSEPKAVFSNTSQNVFKIKQLNPGEKKTITIKGSLVGQNTEKKFFSFELGDSIPFRNEIRTLFSKVEKEVAIKKPDISLAIKTREDNSKGEAIVKPGSSLDLVMELTNNLDSIISDLKITADVPDNLIVKKKLRADKGFYDSNKNKIIWNKNTNEKLKAIKPLSSLSQEFSMDFLELEDIAGYVKDPEIDIDFTVSGINFDNQNSEGSILEKFSKVIKIPTQITLATEITHNKEEPFKNIGSENPVVGEVTTYTVAWKIYNSNSDITDVEVRAKLPPYVKYLDNVSPEKSYISYEPTKREVVWRNKKVDAFIGYRTDPKTVYFQIEYIPTDPHIGNRPTLIEKSRLIAKDSFIGSERVITSPAQNTVIKDYAGISAVGIVRK